MPAIAESSTTTPVDVPGAGKLGALRSACTPGTSTGKVLGLTLWLSRPCVITWSMPLLFGRTGEFVETGGLEYRLGCLETGPILL